MKRYKVGTRVCARQAFEEDKSRFSGTVKGHAIIDGTMYLIVELDKGGYISNEKTHGYVSMLVVHLDNAQQEE